jgi:3-deoxy-D-manno-octulosonic-acid transferase
VPRGGHNPLEPAQFGVPVIIGPSYENFRDIVGRLKKHDGIVIVGDLGELATAFCDAVRKLVRYSEIGRRGQAVFEEQQGATARTVVALTALLPAQTEARR